MSLVARFRSGEEVSWLFSLVVASRFPTVWGIFM